MASLNLPPDSYITLLGSELQLAFDEDKPNDRRMVTTEHLNRSQSTSFGRLTNEIMHLEAGGIMSLTQFRFDLQTSIRIVAEMENDFVPILNTFIKKLLMILTPKTTGCYLASVLAAMVYITVAASHEKRWREWLFYAGDVLAQELPPVLRRIPPPAGSADEAAGEPGPPLDRAKAFADDLFYNGGNGRRARVQAKQRASDVIERGGTQRDIQPNQPLEALEHMLRFSRPMTWNVMDTNGKRALRSIVAAAITYWLREDYAEVFWDIAGRLDNALGEQNVPDFLSDYSLVGFRREQPGRY